MPPKHSKGGSAHKGGDGKAQTPPKEPPSPKVPGSTPKQNVKTEMPVETVAKPVVVPKPIEVAKPSAAVAAERPSSSPASRSLLEQAELQIRQELGSLDAYLHNKGKVRLEVAKDGACLFRSMAQVLFGIQSLHMKVRESCVDHLLEREQEYMYFIDLACDMADASGVHKEYLAYAEKLREETAWGGQLELQALSQCFQCNFEIYQALPLPAASENPEAGEPTHEIITTKIENGFTTKLVYLAYSHGNHYDAVMDIIELEKLNYFQKLTHHVLDTFFSSDKDKPSYWLKDLEFEKEREAPLTPSQLLEDFDNRQWKLWKDKMHREKTSDETLARRLMAEETGVSDNFKRTRKKNKPKATDEISQAQLARYAELTGQHASSVSDAEMASILQANKLGSTSSTSTPSGTDDSQLQALQLQEDEKLAQVLADELLAKAFEREENQARVTNPGSGNSLRHTTPPSGSGTSKSTSSLSSSTNEVSATPKSPAPATTSTLTTQGPSAPSWASTVSSTPKTVSIPIKGPSSTTSTSPSTSSTQSKPDDDDDGWLPAGKAKNKPKDSRMSALDAEIAQQEAIFKAAADEKKRKQEEATKKQQLPQTSATTAPAASSPSSPWTSVPKTSPQQTTHAQPKSKTEISTSPREATAASFVIPVTATNTKSTTVTSIPITSKQQTRPKPQSQLEQQAKPQPPKKDSHAPSTGSTGSQWTYEPEKLEQQTSAISFKGSLPAFPSAAASQPQQPATVVPVLASQPSQPTKQPASTLKIIGELPPHEKPVQIVPQKSEPTPTQPAPASQPPTQSSQIPQHQQPEQKQSTPQTHPEPQIALSMDSSPQVAQSRDQRPPRQQKQPQPDQSIQHHTAQTSQEPQTHQQIDRSEPVPHQSSQRGYGRGSGPSHQQQGQQHRNQQSHQRTEGKNQRGQGRGQTNQR